MKKDNNTVSDSLRQATMWNRNYKLLILSNCLLFLSLTMCNSLVAKYAEFISSNEATVGIISGAFVYTALVLKLVSGAVIDTYNRKNILIISMLVLALSFWGYGISGSVRSLFLFRLLQGAAQAFSAACCLTLAADYVPKENMGSGIGYFSLVQVACMAFAPTVALHAENLLGYKGAFFSAALMMGAGALLVSFIKSKHVGGKKFRITLNSIFCREAIPAFVLILLLSAPYCVISSFMLIYGDKLGLGTDIGLFFILYAIVMILTRPFMGRLLDKRGFFVVLVPSLICYGLSLVFIGVGKNMLWFSVAAIMLALGYGVCIPAAQTLSMESVDTEQRGASSCMNYFGFDFGNLLGSAVGGKVAESFGYPAMWLSMLVPLLIALLFTFALRKKHTV